MEISNAEIKNRQKTFLGEMQHQNAETAILFSTTDIFYLTGFQFRPSERPIVFFIDADRQTHLFVPLMEREHAEEYAVIDHVHHYPEYPGLKHPMEYLKETLITYGFQNKKTGVDAKGYSSAKGYDGPEITDLIDVELVSLKGEVERLRYIKSPRN